MLRPANYAVVLFSLVSVLGVSFASVTGWTLQRVQEEEEHPVQLADMPAEVHSRILVELLKELDDVRFEEATREVEGDRLVFEVEFELGNRDLEMEIDASGKLLEKTVEVEDEEDDDDDDDEDEDDDEDDV